LSCNLKEQAAKDFENLQNVMSGEFTKDGQFNFGAKILLPIFGTMWYTMAEVIS
jgi:hypothetical protein